ncbi:hypothetical protein GPM19_08870 [Halomonas sp. ZH2S]|uniref:FimV N-terminal domain-containing protein n=1 Tax=Vreelandella zhuhanensis TaxID=2684210 RepID=A0A7X3H0J8_9GAMM|nr:FimV/HubP family polar landmark protein [Halomonas zhuhanensis]MWJ28316.1 hypothetical protein [Halomonas zhuhanensis]
MRHTLTFAMLLALLSTSPLVAALGLGQATVESPLNTPLKASIPLLDISGSDIEQLSAQVADEQDFEAIGLARTPLAASVQADISRVKGEWQVQLSTQRPVNDPWLDLLLYLDSPQGRQVREVTLLLDPPDYASMPSLEEGSSQASPSASASRSTNAPVAQPSSSSGAYISRGDTLWSVAERLRPAEVNVQQMMIALLEANPNVFPSGNIHEMREGLTLEVPPPSRVMARSPDSAAETIQAMNQAWSRRDGGTPEAVPLPSVQMPDPLEISETAIAASIALTGVMQPEAPSREALAEERARLADLERRWEESQATIQTLLTERESLHEEVDQLHGLLYTLREELDALATDPPKVARATQDDPWWQAGAALWQHYQWWVTGIAIALLLAVLVALRRRRDVWEEPVIADSDISRAEPQVPSAGVSSSAMNRATSSIQARDETQAAPSSHTDALLHDEAPGMSVAHSYAAVDDQAEKAPSARNEAEPEPPTEEAPLQWDDSETPMIEKPSESLEEPSVTDPVGGEAPEMPAPAKQDRERMIDYEPPVLSNEEAVREETPMQPTIDFTQVSRSSEPFSAQLPASALSELEASTLKPQPSLTEKMGMQRYPHDTKGFDEQPEIDWEIEEVAFDARDLDNSQPANSQSTDKHKADSSRHIRDAPSAYRPDGKQ